MTDDTGSTTRRAAAFGLAGLFAVPAAAQPAGLAPIVQPAKTEPAAFMARAVDMRRLAERAGDQGFGAVVVKDSRIVGEAPSRVIIGNDPTAHAEIEAIRDACRRLGTRSLAGATLYGTFRACPMCEAAAAWAGIARLVYGEALTDAGAPRLSRC